MMYLFPKNDRFYSLRLLQEPKHARMFAWWFGGILAAVFLCLFLPWTQNVKGKGKLTAFTPQSRPQEIPSLITGRISKWYILEGQSVKKGDTIVSLLEVKEKFLDPNLLKRLAEQLQAKKSSLSSNKAKARAYQDQINILKQSSNLGFEKAENKFKQSRQKVLSDSADVEAMIYDNNIQKIQLDRAEGLFRQGLKSLTEIESKRSKYKENEAKLISVKNKLASTRQEFQNARIELLSVRADYQDKIYKSQAEFESTESYVYSLEGEISKMENELESTRLRSGFYHILAPQDGYITKATQAGLGDVIKENDPIVTILPLDRENAAEILIRPIDLPLVRIGMHVRLQFEGWPVIVFAGWQNASFGTFGGEIMVIDKVDTDGLYRILIVPDKVEQKPWPSILPIGSGVKGWIMLNDVPIWYELWRELNGFPPNDGKIPKEKKEKKK